eukprot:s737_g51.t1
MAYEPLLNRRLSGRHPWSGSLIVPLQHPLAESLSAKRITSSSQGLAVNYLKALSWVAKHAGFPDLLAALQLPLTKAYGVASSLVPRREAPPLPLSFVIWFETSSLSTSGTVADRLIMGGILLMVWGSLRWSDTQWISSCELVEDVESLRGLARRTKSSEDEEATKFRSDAIPDEQISQRSSR